MSNILKITDCIDFDSTIQFYIDHDVNENEIRILAEASNDDLSVFKRLAHRRLYQEPMPYILNKKNFMGIDLYIDSRVYIPNPETENLIDIVIKDVAESQISVPYILDVGTGCGAIAIALKNNIKPAKVFGCDFHYAAIEVAKINSEKTKTDITFFESFYVDNYLDYSSQQPSHIVANMPYGKKCNRLVLDSFKEFEDYELQYLPSTSTFHPLGIVDAYDELIQSILNKKWKTSLYIESGKLPLKIIKRIIPQRCDYEYIPYTNNGNLNYSITKITFN